MNALLQSDTMKAHCCYPLLERVTGMLARLERGGDFAAELATLRGMTVAEVAEDRQAQVGKVLADIEGMAVHAADSKCGTHTWKAVRDVAAAFRAAAAR